jgi:hypothetical protein
MTGVGLNFTSNSSATQSSRYSCKRHLSVRPLKAPPAKLEWETWAGCLPPGVVNLNKDHIFEVFGGCRI